jgi:hypothetical protein
MKTLFSIFFVLFLLLESFGQGCSDAGFCTMGAMRPDQHKNKFLNLKLNSLEFTQHFGYTKFGDYILSYIADVDFKVKPKTTIHLKLPYTFIFNKMPTVHGIGDISLSATQILLQKENIQIAGTIGGKIPTNGSNLSHNGLPLPSYYQTSLGTYDLVAGLGISYKDWLFATGYQMAFNRMKNQFLRYSENGILHNSFDGTEYFDEANAYANSKELQRKPDVMLRVERNFRIGRFNAHLGILNIYRLANDEATNFQGQRIEIADSKGLTVNGLLGAGYRFSAHSAIKVLFGRKLSTKERNPDGLSREYVNNIIYEIRF